MRVATTCFLGLFWGYIWFRLAEKIAALSGQWPWRKCYACVPVPGLLPDSWDQLLPLCGHHGEGSLGSPKEEETKSIHSETKCQKKRRISEEESQCFNWKEVIVSRWTRSPFSGVYIVHCWLLMTQYTVIQCSEAALITRYTVYITQCIVYSCTE